MQDALTLIAMQDHEYKFCQAFPPLCTSYATELLLHLGKLCLVHGQLKLVINLVKTHKINSTYGADASVVVQ